MIFDVADLIIKEIHECKKQFLDLLLIGDEQEEMIDRYLDRGRLFIGFIGENPVACCVVTYEEDEKTAEIKNLAVASGYRCHGFGRAMLEYAEEKSGRDIIQLGTGETPSTLAFYNNCGYRYSHRIPDFFVENYDHQIVEEGVRLADMIYLKKQLR